MQEAETAGSTVGRGMDSAMDAVWCWDRGYVRRRRLDVGALLGTCLVFKVPCDAVPRV